MDDTLAKDVRFRAREWTIALHSPDVADEQRRACDEWRRQSPEHERAFRDAQRVWGLLGAMPEDRAQARAASRSGRQPGHPARVTALAASIVACTIGLLYLFSPAGGIKTLLADVRTAPGEQRVVELSDGTRLRLNGASALSYRLESQRREIHLVAGEAHFEVAHDATRPMFVTAGEARIRVTGTRFDVRLADDGTVMTLEEGSVLASRASSAGASVEVPVRPHEQVVWKAGVPLRPSAADIPEALSWQRGRMVFKSRSVADVVEQLARYRRGRVLVLGDAGSEIVTGVFDISAPDAVLRTLERTLDVDVIRVTSLLTIIY